MWKYTTVCILFGVLQNENVFALWDEFISCPSVCTCRLEHLTEMAIFRFIHDKADNSAATHQEILNSNDVLSEETFDAEILEDRGVVKSATCIILTETDPLELFQTLPNDIESLTLIQGADSGNKSFKFSYTEQFEKLVSLELLGSNNYNPLNFSYLTCEIDRSVTYLKYLNMERVVIKNSKKQLQKFVNEENEEVITFEYVQKVNGESRPVTMLQKNPSQVLPYNKYVQQEKVDNLPLFIGFNNLLLLRITSCDLNTIHWEMFERLHMLKFLILEKNNLRFIPDFAFYGTPNLQSLSLAHNNLLNIQIADLAGLLELEYLDLSHNNFSQLSELSLPPFPKLKLANFANNPISIIFPNTFEVMNTTDSLILGGEETSLSLLADAFLGLTMLQKLTINHLNISLLKRGLLVGMPALNTLILTGNITEIEYDAFLEVRHLDTLILSHCNIYNLSMDSFIGLDKLVYLDLSSNHLTYLPPGVFDPLRALKELYLNKNAFTNLPQEIFSGLHVKLLRLNDNPWHCSCEMSEWKPMIVNKIKHKTLKPCEAMFDKSISCSPENRFTYKYVYENKIAPKCATPMLFVNWSVFNVMRRQLRCKNYKPKFKKHYKQTSNKTQVNKIDDATDNNKLNEEYIIAQSKHQKPTTSFKKTNLFNDQLLDYKGINDQIDIDEVQVASKNFPQFPDVENDYQYNELSAFGPTLDNQNYKYLKYNQNHGENIFKPIKKARKYRKNIF